MGSFKICLSKRKCILKLWYLNFWYNYINIILFINWMKVQNLFISNKNLNRRDGNLLSLNKENIFSSWSSLNILSSGMCFFVIYDNLFKFVQRIIFLTLIKINSSFFCLAFACKISFELFLKICFVCFLSLPRNSYSWHINLRSCDQ